MAAMTDLYMKRDSKLRARFGDLADGYDKYRFSYPDALYEDIWSYCSGGTAAIEIGIGTGKATLPFLQKEYKITAVDPSSQMMSIAMEKYKQYDIKYVLSTFEDAEFSEKTDLIYAASSFHWVNDINRVQKVYDLLKPDGCFVRFKTMSFIPEGECENNDQLLELYRKYIPEYIPDNSERKHMRDSEYIDIGFGDIQRREYYITREYTLSEYLKLINTYTEYNALQENIRHEFESEMIDALKTDPNFILMQKCTLFMTRKMVSFQ